MPLGVNLQSRRCLLPPRYALQLYHSGTRTMPLRLQETLGHLSHIPGGQLSLRAVGMVPQWVAHNRGEPKREVRLSKQNSRGRLQF